MLCPYCNRNQMYKGSDGKMRCPYCHDVVAAKASFREENPPNDWEECGCCEDRFKLPKGH